MKKILSLTLGALLLSLLVSGQAIYNNGGRITSTTGAYLVVDNAGFTFTSTSADNLAQFDQLTILADASLTLPTNSCLTVDGTLVNQGSFVLNAGSSLITNESIANSGTFNVKQSLTSSNEVGEWHYISSPTSYSTANIFYDMYLQEYNEPTHLWLDITDQTETLTPGKGYALWVPTTKANLTYSGTPNTGEKSIGMTFTEYSDDPLAYEGSNLVGNPYPSYVDFDKVGGYGSKYTWNGTAYVSYSEGSGSGSRYIAPMEGFILVTTANKTFTIENGDRTHTSSSKSEENKILKQGLVLSASNGTYNDDLWLLLDDYASQNFELQDDAWKFKTNTPGISQLWSVCPDGNLSIDARPETETIQLGFSNDVNGTYRIGSQQINGIAMAELEDTKLNQFHDLTKGAYDFDWQTTDSEERFILHLKATVTEEMEAQDAQVYVTSGQVYIRMNEQNQFNQVMIYDLAGRLIYQNQLSQQNLQSFNLSHLQGAYLVQLVSDSGTQIEKVILE